MNLVVWDIDDVLNPLMRDWFEQHWLPRHSECRIAYQELTANPPHRVLGIAEDEYLKYAIVKKHLNSMLNRVGNAFQCPACTMDQ